MKRLLISLFGGFVIPLVYTVVVAPTSGYINERTLNHYIALPVRWPIILLNNYIYSRWPPGAFPVKSEIALLLYLVICNVALYGSMTYFILWSLKRRQVSRLPPVDPSRDSL